MGQDKPVILLSPLDWGLGHAARMVPVIDYFLKAGYKVVVLASGKGYHFYKKRYKKLDIRRIPAFRLRYGKGRLGFGLMLPVVTLKFSLNFFVDRIVSRFYCRRFSPQMVISDNRYGIRCRRGKSIVIAHHLNIILSGRFLRYLVRRINCLFIKAFDELWIPDNETLDLSGGLSHNFKCNVKKRYIGLLSRFEHYSCQQDGTYDIVAIVSGLEPQRSMLVRQLTQIFSQSSYSVWLLSGKPEDSASVNLHNITVLPHAADQDFCRYVKGAKYVIARAGYSTLMDLVSLERTALIIPTPGQTEQEYLADYLHGKRLFFAVRQEDFSIKKLKEFAEIQSHLQQNIKEFVAKNVTGTLEQLGIIPGN